MIDRYTLVNTSYVLKTFKNDGENFEPIYNAYPTKKLPIITLSKNDEIKVKLYKGQFSAKITSTQSDRKRY